MRTSATNLASELHDKELVFLKELLPAVCKGGAVLKVGMADGGTLREMMACSGPISGRVTCSYEV
ncbi:MAG: hypothetical protein ACPGVU_19335 [Limisphaerales bacterium]